MLDIVRTADPKLLVGASTASSQTPAKLRDFMNGAGWYPGFHFTRYWWDGPGQREGITPFVLNKLKPGDHPEHGWAAKAELLPPDTAPGDYACLTVLLERYDRLPSFDVHAMVQVKIALDADEPWHVGYERVRSYTRAHFVAQGFAVILAAHVPNTAGLDGYGSHIHCIVPARPIGINGFKGACTGLCSDRGHEAAWKAWKAHLLGEGRA